MDNIRTPIVGLLLLFSTTCVVRAAEIYVDDSHTSGTFDGTTWATSFQYLQDALDIAVAGDVIHVAQGTYYPDLDGGFNPPSHTAGSRSETFKMKSDVTIQGGYIGYDDALPNTRNPALYPSILSGDLNGDDEPDFGNRTDNSYHVITAEGVNDGAILNDFTITGGNADGQNHQNGAGLWIREGTNPLVSSNPRVFNCIFENNIAKRATTINGTGGAVHSQAVASTANTLSFQNCVFRENAAGLSGGACYISSAEQVDFIGCTFSGNSTIDVPTSGAGTHGGGGLYVSGNSSQVVTLIDSVFTHNSTSAGEECGRESFTDAGGGV